MDAFTAGALDEEALQAKMASTLVQPSVGDDVEIGPNITKTIVRDGAGFQDETPSALDVVKLTLSIWRGDAEEPAETSEALQVELGKKQLPSAIEAVVETMRKGETARVQLKDDAAASVCTPRGWPTEPLKLEVTLTGIQRAVDVLGDGGIKKRIITSGEGRKASEECTVTVRLRGYTSDVVFDSRQEPPASVVVGLFDDKSTVLDQSIYEILRTCRKGEKSECIIQPAYAFGADGSAERQIGPDTCVFYDLEVLDISEPVDANKLTPSQRIAEAYRRKETGTSLFNQGKYHFALQDYSKAIGILENDYTFVGDDKAESKKVKFACGLNMAACQLKLEEYADVVGICTALLEQDPKSSKALFRRAQAYEKRGETENAIRDYTAALSLSDGDAAVKKALANLQADIKARNEQDREKFKKLFPS